MPQHFRVDNGRRDLAYVVGFPSGDDVGIQMLLDTGAGFITQNIIQLKDV
jgi:hypothetical protein